MPLLDELRAKSEQIKDCAYACGLMRDVKVFGSVARGEETVNSDVDFLIDVHSDTDPLGFVDFQDAMSRMTGRKVDIVFEKGIYHALRDRIHKEAVSL